MKEIFFGGWREGHLKRLAYLGYSLLLIVIPVAIILGVLFLVKSITGDLNVFREVFRGSGGMIAMIFVGLFSLALLAANLNITAKRFRDMGLPGWWSVAAMFLLAMVVQVLFGGESTLADAGMTESMGAQQSSEITVVDIFNLVLFAILVFVPSDTFGKKHSVES